MDKPRLAQVIEASKLDLTLWFVRDLPPPRYLQVLRNSIALRAASPPTPRQANVGRRT